MQRAVSFDHLVGAQHDRALREGEAKKTSIHKFPPLLRWREQPKR
jgi:hypothetical protein